VHYDSRQNPPNTAWAPRIDKDFEMGPNYSGQGRIISTMATTTFARRMNSREMVFYMT